MKRVARIVLAVAAAGCFSAVVSNNSYAAGLPGRVTPLPNPPEAPVRDIFLVTLAHSHQVPTRAVFTFRGRHSKAVTATETFRKVNKYQYETAWAPPGLGSLQFQAYTADNHLVAQAHYPVTKAKTDVVGRVILGGIFIGGSVFLWYRQRQFYRR